MKYFKLLLSSLVVGGVFLLSPAAYANWAPVCSGGQQLKIKLRPGQPSGFRCERKTNPTCADGRAPRTNHTGPDTCNAPPTVRAPTGCKLGIGRSQSNWSIKRNLLQGNRDGCKHKTRNVPDKQIKCPAGFTQNIKPGFDNCKKNSGARTPARCPAGSTRRPAGKDKCVTESRPNWRNVP